ncbi:DUF3899 domain-containing protein [Liquorilactobacillus capillatus]|nr:DUF3899 domain-containing protein [Liquorilactobacillus capillatus]
MQWLKQKIYFKSVSATLLITIIILVVAKLTVCGVLLSNILFTSGLLLICISIIDVLLRAHLLAGWFRHKKKGETDEEYRKNKIKVNEVGSLKNMPVQSSKFGRSCLAAGSILILGAILITI